MAISKYNVVMHNTSGIVGDLLEFSQRYGKTIIGKRRRKSSTVSEVQLEIRRKFKKACSYAKQTMAIPERAVLYEAKAKPGVTPYNLAVANYFTAPTIVEIITDEYKGAAGDRLDLLVDDAIIVVSVEVSIYTADNELVESGPAVKTEEGFWHYIATADSPQLAGSRIAVTAKNLPGNSATEEQVL